MTLSYSRFINFNLVNFKERDANKKKKPVFHLHVGIKVYVKMILKIIVIPVSVDPATMAVIVRIT